MSKSKPKAKLNHRKRARKAMRKLPSKPPQTAAQNPDCPYRVGTLYATLFTEGNHDYIEKGVYRMIQRGKLRARRGPMGKLLVPRSELLKLLKTE
jgi:hypothetical protein